MPPHLLDPTKHWRCPSCGGEHATNEARPHTPMHTCAAQRGLSVPFVEVVRNGQASRHLVVEREDYEGTENVTRDGEGRPIMAVRVERADGSNDAHVFAPMAKATAVAT